MSKVLSTLTNFLWPTDSESCRPGPLAQELVVKKMLLTSVNSCGRGWDSGHGASGGQLCGRTGGLTGVKQVGFLIHRYRRDSRMCTNSVLSDLHNLLNTQGYLAGTFKNYMVWHLILKKCETGKEAVITKYQKRITRKQGAIKYYASLQHMALSSILFLMVLPFLAIA